MREMINGYVEKINSREKWKYLFKLILAPKIIKKLRNCLKEIKNILPLVVIYNFIV